MNNIETCNINFFDVLKDSFVFQILRNIEDEHDKLSLSLCSKRFNRIYKTYLNSLKKGNERKQRIKPLNISEEKITKAMSMLFDDLSPRKSQEIEVTLKPVDPSVKDPITVKLEITRSKIPGAGNGIIANSKIKKGYMYEYEGEWIPKELDDLCTVSEYRWTVFKYDPQTGEPLNDTDVIGIVDGYDLDKSNWTRYVNCSLSPEEANMNQLQLFNKVYYATNRDIEIGEELLVWYGIAFAKILGIKCPNL